MDLIERLINKDYLTERERKEWLGTIKERLEALEKENKKWREIVGCDLCEALGREILLEENKKLKKIKTNIENKIKFIESCIVTQELNGNEVAIFNLKWQIDILKEVLENENNFN